MVYLAVAKVGLDRGQYFATPLFSTVYRTVANSTLPQLWICFATVLTVVKSRFFGSVLFYQL